MSDTALSDLLAALALMMVFEGIVFAVFMGRLPEMLEQLREADPDRLRWVGLAVALAGAALYMMVRG